MSDDKFFDDLDASVAHSMENASTLVEFGRVGELATLADTFASAASKDKAIKNKIIKNLTPAENRMMGIHVYARTTLEKRRIREDEGEAQQKLLEAGHLETLKAADIFAQATLRTLSAEEIKKLAPGEMRVKLNAQLYENAGFPSLAAVAKL